MRLYPSQRRNAETCQYVFEGVIITGGEGILEEGRVGALLDGWRVSDLGKGITDCSPFSRQDRMKYP